ERQDIVGIELKIDPARATILNAQDVAVAGQVLMRYRYQALRGADRRGLVVVEGQPYFIGIPLLDAHVQHTLAKPHTGPQLSVEPLNSTVLQQELQPLL